MNTTARSLCLQAHVLCAFTQAAHEGRLLPLDELTERLGVTRADVRNAVSELHIDGFVDALRMRVTMSGFVFGTYLGEQKLTPLVAFEQAPRHAALSPRVRDDAHGRGAVVA